MINKLISSTNAGAAVGNHQIVMNSGDHIDVHHICFVYNLRGTMVNCYSCYMKNPWVPLIHEVPLKQAMQRRGREGKRPSLIRRVVADSGNALGVRFRYVLLVSRIVDDNQISLLKYLYI